MLEGSIRRAGQRVRITAQLIDAANGAHVWADRYDRDLTDIFEVQDDVTHRIVDALKVTLSPAENARLTDGGTSNMDAYDWALRGREFLLGTPKNRETFEQSKASFTKALELDPNYSQAYAGLGMAYMFDYQNRWSDDPDSSLRLGKRYAERAIEKNPKRTAGATLSRRGPQYTKRTFIGQNPRQRSRCPSIRISPWPTTLLVAFAATRDSP